MTATPHQSRTAPASPQGEASLCAVRTFAVRASSADIMAKKYPPSFKVLEGWGFGGRKASFKKFPSPALNTI